MDNGFSLISSLRPCNTKVLVGFDGFIDEIYRVRRFGDGYFTSLGSFGEYVAGKAGRSCSMELCFQKRKLGGNMPIMSLALARLGIDIHCIGALGYPEPDPIFSELVEKCAVTSVCAPGLCDAVEFDDGKMMLSKNESINSFDYQLLLERIGLEKLKAYFEESDMIVLLNWSELLGVQSIWEGLKTDVFPALSRKERGIFVDFSDCSGRSESDVLRAVDTLKAFSGYGTLTLSLNLNEAERIGHVLDIQADDADTLSEILKAQIGCERLVIHLPKSAVGVDDGGRVEAKTRFIEKPVLSTGGGDNFNAGFLYGLLSGAGFEEALYTGNAVASFYVANGYSPSLSELETWIRS